MASSSLSSPGGDSSAVPLSSPPIPPVRSEMVAAAKQFLANPRVRNTPLKEQTEFLRAKGLTETEIQKAMQMTAAEVSAEGGEQMPSTSLSPLSPPPLSSPPFSSARAIVDLARSALLFGTAGYMVYRFVRSWMLPQLLNVPDPSEERMQRLEQQVERLSDSTRCIAESVTQTLVAVTEQNEQLSRTMMIVQGGAKGSVSAADIDRVHAEVGIVKSLLLNQSQFPPVPESAFPRHRRVAQNGLNSTKGKMPLCQEKDGNEEEKSKEREEEQQQNGEMLNENKNGSPV